MFIAVFMLCLLRYVHFVLDARYMGQLPFLVTFILVPSLPVSVTTVQEMCVWWSPGQEGIASN